MTSSLDQVEDETRGLDKVRIVGDLFPVRRIETGLWSLDRALGFRGDNGVPLRSLFELYGFEHSGKSTLAWFIAARISATGTIWVADLEGTIDQNYIREVVTNAGFEGTVRIADYTKRKGRKTVLRTHEEQVQDAIDALLEPEVNASVVDSIGMFWPVVDAGKDLGERSVGQRAKTIADASRRIAAWLRMEEEPKLCFFINHVHQTIGGRGYDTPGGVTKKYAANVRVWLQRIDSKVGGEGNFLAEARVQKLKFGGANPDRKGLIYFIPGFGVSKEMTDVFDCVGLGIAKRAASIELLEFDDKKGEDVWVKMGRIGTLAEKAEEPHKHKALFKRFADALERYETSTL
jgi:RecA/RadA recombinase